MGLTPLCDLLGIEFPIIEGGLAYIGNAELAAALSNAGGLGVIGAGGIDAAELERRIDLCSRLTNKPFGVNLPISTHRDITPHVEAVLAAKDRVKVVTLSAGNPKPLVPVFKEAGMKVLVVVAAVKQAVKVQEMGADAVVAEGFEAGGHNGPAELTTLALIPQIRRKITIPLVAAGGICDGRGMAAALALGADGVQLGTRLVATEECMAHENYKQAIVDVQDDGTTVLERSIGGVMRVIKGPYVEKVLEFEKTNPTKEELYPYIKGEKNRLAEVEGKLAEGYYYSGQGGGLIDEVLPVKAVVDRMMREAGEVISRLPRW